MAEALVARGLAVTIAATDDAGPGRRMAPSEWEDRCSRFSARGIALFLAPKQTEFYKVSLPLARWLWRHVRDYDLVHIHALFSFSSVAAALAAAWRGVPFIVRPLGVLGRYGMSKRRPWLKRSSFVLIERPILRRAAAVHCTSRAEAAQVEGLVDAARAVVIPLGVREPEPANRAGLLEELGLAEGTKRILFLSRLDPKKNLDGLLRALALLQRRGDWPPFLIVAGAGEPDYLAGLQRLAEALGIADRVAWLGPVGGDRKAAAWAAADLFVLASHEENFGIAAAEAMLAGLPCVLAEGVALAAEAAQAGAAVLTSIEPGAIAERIAVLLDDPQQAAATGARARAYAREHYSVDVMGARLHSLYRQVALKS